jgi:PadR family transcriptional regulator PadR
MCTSYMATEPPRVTRNVLVVLCALLEAAGPQHGLALMNTTGLPSGSMYPILDRLERAGWIVGTWETLDPSVERRPRRRNYELTGEGLRVTRSEIVKASTAYGLLPKPGWA